MLVRLALCVGLAFLFARVSFSQETLIMALKSDSVSSPDDVAKSLELAKKTVQGQNSPPFMFEKITGVRRINRSDYDLLWDPFPTLEDTKGIVIKPGELSSADSKILVTSNPYSYIVHTDHRAVVEEIEIGYTKANMTDSTEAVAKFTKAGDDSKESDFSRLRPGVHEIRLKPEWQPRRYRIRFSIVNDKPTDSSNEFTSWETWPGSETSYFLAKLENFSGSAESIFEVLKRVDSALKFENFEVRKRISYLAADLEALGERSPWRSEVVLNDKGFSMKIAVPKEIKAHRIWGLFPVTKEEQALAVELMKTWPQSPYEKMAVLLGKHSESKKLNTYTVVEAPTDADSKIQLTQTSPQWFVIKKPATETPGGSDEFVLNFGYSDKETWAQRLKTADKMIVLIERDPGQGDDFRGIVSFKNEQNVSTFWHEQPISILNE